MLARLIVDRTSLVMWSVSVVLVVAVAAAGFLIRAERAHPALTRPVAGAIELRAGQSCPDTAPRGVKNTGSGLQDKLVPAGASHLLVCRYQGPLEARRAHLVSSGETGSSNTISRIQNVLDSFTKPPKASVCPNEGRQAPILAVFSYPDRRAVTVLVHFPGCTYASNGSAIGIPVAGQGEDELHKELYKLTPTRHGRAGRGGEYVPAKGRTHG